jgi:hypothetical protein
MRQHWVTPIAGVVTALLLTNAVAASDFADFRDWHVACDNLRACVATGGDGASQGGYLRIARGGAADAVPVITIAVYAEKGVTFTLRFNDPALPGLPEGKLEGTSDESGSYRRIVLSDRTSPDTLIASFRKADAIIITRTDPPGASPSDPEKSEISLSGLVAALIWMDDEQKRLDTVTALIKRGPKPASAMPPQPPLPIVVAAKSAGGKSPEKAPPSLIKKGRALCEEEDAGSKLEETYPLAGNMVLYMFICPDSSGAYNAHYGLLAAPAGKPQAARTLSFRWPLQIGDTVPDDDDGTIVVNPSFDPKTGKLTTFSKGRGLGDCGTGEEWVWDGKAFRLVLLKMMVHCRGIPYDDWPVLYRATVK